MDHEQGALLLLLRANRLAADAPLSAADPNDAALARQISEEVGGLPLALDQAGAYLEETGSELEDYSKLLRERFKELAARRGGLDADHLSVAATYLTSFEKLAKQNQGAAELMKATAFLVAGRDSRRNLHQRRGRVWSGFAGGCFRSNPVG